MGKKEAKLIDFLRERGGLASYAEISKAGFNKTLLKTSLKSNRITRLTGDCIIVGRYIISNPVLVAISIKIPKGVICLLSSLAFHEATNEIPKYVDVAIQRGTHANKLIIRR